MHSNRFLFEYVGRLDDDMSWRDNPYYFGSLQVTRKLPVHDGCVNTICWDETGNYLLSGADDRCICITPALLEDCPYKPVYVQELPADSNVFTAEFLPHTNNGQILAGFKCGCVVRASTDRASDAAAAEIIYCHSYAVYDILTLRDHPTCFFTLSHDQSVVFFDTRQPITVCGPCNQRCYIRDSSVRLKNSKAPSAGCMRLNFQFPVTAGDVHPLDGVRRVALGFADGFVRLFDLRCLTQRGSSPLGVTKQPLPYQITRPLGLPAQLDDKRCIRLDYGPAHVTSVKFEPPFCSTSQALYPTSNFDKSVRSSGNRCILVSHMYAPVFLFDTYKKETVEQVDPKTVDWLPHTGGNSNPGVQESTTAEGAPEESRSNRTNDPEIRIALAFFHWLERRRAQRLSEANQNQGGDRQREEEDSSEDSDEHDDPEPVSSATDENAPMNTETKKTPFDLLTDEYVSEVLQSTQRCRQLKAYQGHQSCRTVIKDAVFWGRDHILSGSECGHVIAWNRHTCEPVRVLKADNAVVNRIAPHPTLPIFACSGIDHSIKLVEPSPQIYDSEDEDHWNIWSKNAVEAKSVCEKNLKTTVESLQSGSVHLERLARLRTGQALRQMLHRLMDLNRSST